MTNANNTNKYQAGRRSAQREIAEDSWTVEIARQYVVICGNAISDFDAGYLAAVNAFINGGYTKNAFQHGEPLEDPRPIWPCQYCKRTLPVCNGDGPNTKGEFEWAACYGCSLVMMGNPLPPALESLNFISCGIEGAWKDSKDATAVEYVAEIFGACRDGYPDLAAGYLKLITRNNHAVLMALQNATKGSK